MKLYDICIPQNNEKEIVKLAKDLGYSGAIFLYPLNKLKEVKAKDFEVFTSTLIEGKRISQIRKKDLKKVEFVVAKGDGEESTIKAILSNRNVDFIIDISSVKGREHTHYRKSTLNQVLAKKALVSKIGYIINFNRLLNEEKKVKLMGRIMQNIKIFQKFKVPILISSFATNKYELRNYDNLVSLARFMGVKKVASLEEYISKKKDPNFITEGVKIIKS